MTTTKPQEKESPEQVIYCDQGRPASVQELGEEGMVEAEEAQGSANC